MIIALERFYACRYADPLSRQGTFQSAKQPNRFFASYSHHFLSPCAFVHVKYLASQFWMHKHSVTDYLVLPKNREILKYIHKKQMFVFDF
jgi:hypothetical protein